AVRDGNIEALLPVAQARARFAGYERIALDEHALIPGLVNAHTHAAMTLMRGLADDLPLMRWLEEHIWPAEKRHVSPQFVRDGTLLACAEMLRGGITCFNDMYFFPQAALESALEAGMRSAHGIIVIEFPSAYAADAADYRHAESDRRARGPSQPRRDRAARPPRLLGRALPELEPQARERLCAGREARRCGRQRRARYRWRGEQQPPGHVPGDAQRRAARQSARARRAGDACARGAARGDARRRASARARRAHRLDYARQGGRPRRRFTARAGTRTVL